MKRPCESLAWPLFRIPIAAPFLIVSGGREGYHWKQDTITGLDTFRYDGAEADSVREGALEVYQRKGLYLQRKDVDVEVDKKRPSVAGEPLMIV